MAASPGVQDTQESLLLLPLLSDQHPEQNNPDLPPFQKKYIITFILAGKQDFQIITAPYLAHQAAGQA